MRLNPLKPGWQMVKFGDVVKNANLTERDPAAAGIDRIVGLEHIDPENLHIRRWGAPEDNASFTRKFVPGQTLFGKRRAYQRKVAYAEFEGICSGDILTFEPINRKQLLPELLPFICQTDKFFDYALGTSAGSLSPRTSWGALKEFEFPLPPIEEQKRIAEILWAADEAIERLGESFAKAQKAEYSLAHNLIPVSQVHIFTGKLKQRIQADFKIVQGSFLFTAQSGNGEPTPSIDSNGNSLFFKVADFNRNNEETYLSEAEITFSKEQNQSIRLFPPGTIIFPKRGATIFLNKVGQLLKPAALDPNLMALVPKENKCVSGYLYWLIKLIRLHRVSETTSLPQLNHKHLMPLWLPAPPFDKQKQIVGLLDSMREQKNRVRTHLAKCVEVKKQLMEKYIGIAHV